jgi:hypothetical protein
MCQGAFGVLVALRRGRWRGRLRGGIDVADQGDRTITRCYTVTLFCDPVATALTFVSVWFSLGMHFALALCTAPQRA